MTLGLYEPSLDVEREKLAFEREKWGGAAPVGSRTHPAGERACYQGARSAAIQIIEPSGHRRLRRGDSRRRQCICDLVQQPGEF